MERMVFVMAGESYVLIGDPEEERLDKKALPILLGEGWSIKQIITAHRSSGSKGYEGSDMLYVHLVKIVAQ